MGLYSLVPSIGVRRGRSNHPLDFVWRTPMFETLIYTIMIYIYLRRMVSEHQYFEAIHVKIDSHRISSSVAIRRTHLIEALTKELRIISLVILSPLFYTAGYRPIGMFNFAKLLSKGVQHF